MRNFLSTSFTLSIAVFLVAACASSNPASLTQNGPRTIVLNGNEWTEEVAGRFASWYCYDRVNLETLGKGPIRLEVGLFGNPSFSDVGFLLYDGGKIWNDDVSFSKNEWNNSYGIGLFLAPYSTEYAISYSLIRSEDYDVYSQFQLGFSF